MVDPLRAGHNPAKLSRKFSPVLAGDPESRGEKRQ
jgi:hypothetical protein